MPSLWKRQGYYANVGWRHPTLAQTSMTEYFIFWPYLLSHNKLLFINSFPAKPSGDNGLNDALESYSSTCRMLKWRLNRNIYSSEVTNACCALVEGKRKKCDILAMWTVYFEAVDGEGWREKGYRGGAILEEDANFSVYSGVWMHKLWSEIISVSWLTSVFIFCFLELLKCENFSNVYGIPECEHLSVKGKNIWVIIIVSAEGKSSHFNSRCTSMFVKLIYSQIVNWGRGI